MEPVLSRCHLCKRQLHRFHSPVNALLDQNHRKSSWQNSKSALGSVLTSLVLIYPPAFSPVLQFFGPLHMQTACFRKCQRLSGFPKLSSLVIFNSLWWEVGIQSWLCMACRKRHPGKEHYSEPSVFPGTLTGIEGKVHVWIWAVCIHTALIQTNRYTSPRSSMVITLGPHNEWQ